MVRDIRILTGLDKFCPLLNVYSWYLKKYIRIYRDLVSSKAKNQELDLRNYVFLKFPIYFTLFFDEYIVKLGIDHALCEETAATDG